MTACERLAKVKHEQCLLRDTIAKVLEAESALDWCYTPAKPLITKVYRTAKEEHGILFADDFIKVEINRVAQKMRREVGKQRK